MLARAVVGRDTIIVHGRAFSVLAGAPSDAELAREFGLELIPQVTQRPLPTVAQYHLAAYGPEIYQRIRAIYGRRALRPTRAHELLCGLPVSRIITTTWDYVLERTYRQMGRERPNVISHGRELNGEAPAHAVRIYKLRGDLNQSATIVVTDDDHRQQQQPGAALWEMAVSLLRCHTPVFVGESLRDPDIGLLVAQAAGDRPHLPRTAFALTTESDPHVLGEWRRRGIRLIRPSTISQTPDAGVVEMLEQLGTAVRATI